MPTWKNVLPDIELWAISHYVRSLVLLRNTPASDALRERLATQPAWTPPPLPTPDADGGGADGPQLDAGGSAERARSR